jgi:hypothetical protein
MGPAISRKRPTEDLEKSFKVIVLNDRKIVKANTNSVSNLFFSRSVMFFGSPVYNKSGDYWYGLPKNRKYQKILLFFCNINQQIK